MSSIGPKDPNGFEFDELIFSSDFCKITNAESSTNTTGTCTTSTDFKIHTVLLASLSPELKKYLENETKEGLLGTVVLKEVDKDTILKFLQWAYRGTYSVPVYVCVQILHAYAQYLRDKVAELMEEEVVRRWSILEYIM